MIRHDRRLRTVAACLTAVAGFVDAIGYLNLGGYFVSFMSGNSTQMAVSVARSNGNLALLAGALIGLFLVGVTAGSLVGAASGVRRRPFVLLFVSGFLGIATALALGEWQRCAIAAATIAMGAANAVFKRDGEIIGLTYMTGTLVKLGQRAADALSGGDPSALAPLFLSWVALVAGAIVGALVYPKIGLAAFGIASVFVSVLAMVVFRIDRDVRMIER